MPFAKGTPRAPGAGRKPGSTNKATRALQDIARSYAPEAIEIAAKIMRDGRMAGAARVSAANLILDRGYGKPTQAVQHSGTVGHRDASEYSDAELAAIIAGDRGNRDHEAPESEIGDNSIH